MCPAISPGLRLGPEPGASFCSLRSAPGRGDGIQGTSALAARGLQWGRRLLGELMRRWPGLGSSAESAGEGGREGEEEPAAGAPPGAREKEEPAEEEREQGQEARRAST